jgi:hypothetical protein
MTGLSLIVAVFGATGDPRGLAFGGTAAVIGLLVSSAMIRFTP